MKTLRIRETVKLTLVIIGLLAVTATRADQTNAVQPLVAGGTSQTQPAAPPVVAEPKTQVSEKRSKVRTAKQKVRTDRKKLHHDKKQLGKQSPQVKEDRDVLKQDKAALEQAKQSN